jgi:RecA/RadA recombinase
MEIHHKMKTGSKNLDALLGGGVQTGSLTLAYGESGSGKTTIAVSLAAGLLRADPAAMVAYVDSDAKFSPVRFKQVTGTEDYLRRLLYAQPTTFEEQVEAIDGLPEQLKPGDLAVFDSITGLYRVETGDAKKTFTENKELNRQLGQLKEIAMTVGIAIFITGQVRSILDSPIPAVEPVAPRLLRYWSDTVIRLDNTPMFGVKQATIEKPLAVRGAVRIALSNLGVGDEERWH